MRLRCDLQYRRHETCVNNRLVIVKKFSLTSASICVLLEQKMHAIEGTGNVPAFLTKLWTLVDDQMTDDLISWTENGRSFIIQNQARFARELLPQYYKHNNMASFVRQLNMYGFHKVVSPDSGGLRVEKDEMEFAHPAFQQGREELIENIKRKQQRRIASDGMDFSQIPMSRAVMEDNKKVGKLLNDVRDMKRDHDTMSTKLLGLKRENEALWREYANMRQKFSKQQQIIEKLIHFLIAMVKSPSKTIIPKRKFGHLALEGGEESNAAAAALNSLPQLAQNVEMLDGLTTGTSRGAKIHEVTDLMDSDDPSTLPNLFTPESSEPDLHVEEISTRDCGTTIFNPNDGAEEESIILVNGEPYLSRQATSIPATSTSYSTPVTVTATSVFSPSGTSLTETQNSKIEAYNKLLDEAPLSPDLLNTVDPSAVTQSFKYASNNSPSIKSSASSGTTKVRAGPSNIQIATKSSQVPFSSSKGKIKAVAVQKSPPHPSMSVAVPEKSFNKNDLQCHMDDMQNSIDSLSEIISSGGFNLDPSMLLTTMFGGDDNLPDLDTLATSSTGNELSVYHPSLLDLADITEDTEDDPMNFLNRSTASTSSAIPGTSSTATSNPTIITTKTGHQTLNPLKVSIKKERIDDDDDDELTTPQVLLPSTSSPLFPGKMERLDKEELTTPQVIPTSASSPLFRNKKRRN